MYPSSGLEHSQARLTLGRSLVVIGRKSPEFVPFRRHTGDMLDRQPYLILPLRLGPVALQRLIRLIPKERWDEARSAERFTPREVVAHLADWEPIFRDRMQRCVAEPGSVLIAYNESDRAHEQDYAAWDIVESTERWIAERVRTVIWLESLEASEWEAEGRHEERGPVSVYDQANMLLGHDTYHLEQMTAYLVE